MITDIWEMTYGYGMLRERAESQMIIREICEMYEKNVHTLHPAFPSEVAAGKVPLQWMSLVKRENSIRAIQIPERVRAFAAQLRVSSNF